jgi:hypothetical protein
MARYERPQLGQGRRHYRCRLERRLALAGAKRKGRREIERLIDAGLQGTSVTAVLEQAGALVAALRRPPCQGLLQGGGLKARSFGS